MLADYQKILLEEIEHRPVITASKAQKNYIEVIEEFTPERFTGISKNEASDYISKYKGCVPRDNSSDMWATINGY